MTALFSKKGAKKPSEVDFRIMRREERTVFFEFLEKIGWVQADTPFEFDENWSHSKIRRAARDSAAQMDADLLVETEDEKFSSSPFNNYVYYVFKRTPDGLPLPQGFSVPPIPLMQQLVMYKQQQMRQKQQQPQQYPGQPPQQPGAPNPFLAGQQQHPQQRPPVPPGQQQAPQQQPRPPPQQAPQQQPRPPPQQAPQQQPRPPQQQAPQQPPQQPRQPPRSAPSPGAPAPSQPCPKCGGPTATLPDGRKQCQKCGIVA